MKRHFYLGLTHTVMGDAEAGIHHAQQALKLAEIVRRPHAYGFGLLANFVTAMLRGDFATAAHDSEQSLEYAQRQGFPGFAAMSLVCQGWCQAKRGALETGIAQMKEGLNLWTMTGFKNRQALFATCLSDAYAEPDSWMKQNGCLMRTTLASTASARTSLSRLWRFREQICSARAGILTVLPELPRRRGSGRFGTKQSYGCTHRGDSGFLRGAAKSLVLWRCHIN